jgi:hypothetical protein
LGEGGRKRERGSLGPVPLGVGLLRTQRTREKLREILRKRRRKEGREGGSIGPVPLGVGLLHHRLRVPRRRPDPGALSEELPRPVTNQAPSNIYIYIYIYI